MPLVGKVSPSSNYPAPVITIVGATGIGKTALAVALGQTFAAEVVSADSRQIYRYMDIGTAKPTPAERAAIPHHLIDIVDPDQTLSMADYQAMAMQAIASIHDQGKIALLVGGTGQYVTALLEGWQVPEVPPNEPLRAELEAYGAEHGSQALFDRLQALDPQVVGLVDPLNMRRVIRALEVCITTNQPFSEQRRKNPPDYQVFEIALTMDREALYQRVDARIDRMISKGLLEEVRHLLEQGYGWRLPSMSGLGYAQLGAYLRGECSLDQAITTFKHATHTFIRRQYTWFRHHGTPIWLETPSDQNGIQLIAELVQSWLNQAQR